MFDTFEAVSDPSLPQYGHHASLPWIREQLAPPPGAAAVVEAWIREAGAGCEGPTAVHHDAGSAWLVASLDAHCAHTLLPGTVFRTYERVQGHGRSTIVRSSTLQYALPEFIDKLVEVIGGLHDFAVPMSAVLASSTSGHTQQQQQQASFMSFGGNNTVVVEVTGRCLDGALFAPGPAPCRSHPPAVAGFRVTVVNASRPEQSTLHSVAFKEVGMTTTGDMGVVAVLPPLPAGGLMWANVTVETVFANGATAAATGFPFNPVVMPQRPWLTPHAVWSHANISAVALGPRNGSNVQSVGSFSLDSFAPADLAASQQLFRLPANPVAK